VTRELYYDIAEQSADRSFQKDSLRVTTVDFKQPSRSLKDFGGFFIALSDTFRVSSTSRKGLRVVSLCLNRLTPECSSPPGIADKNELAKIDHNAEHTKSTEKSGAKTQGLPSAFLPS
jgi:hypothetical protein